MKIEVSIGEIIDKYSILNIKAKKIVDSAKLKKMTKVWLTNGLSLAVPAYREPTFLGANYYDEKSGQLIWQQTTIIFE